MLINYNLITGIFNLYPDNTYPGRLDLVIKNAQPLFNLKIPIVVFCDTYTIKKIPDGPHIIKHLIRLEDLETYRRGLTVRLPAHRCNIKDTAEFIAFGNVKMELVELAKQYSCNDYIMWIDAGIYKIVEQDVLKTLKYKWFCHTGILVPGIQPHQVLDFNKPMWRFCGGVFVMHRDTDLSIFKRCLYMMYDIGFTTWESNLWAVIEQMKPDDIHWVHGHFNNSIIQCL
jgi:hypothetical protein